MFASPKFITRSKGDKLFLTRHEPRMITAPGELRAELIRILPGPMLRVLNDDPAPKGTQPVTGDPDTDGSLSVLLKELYGTPSGYRFDSQTKYKVQAQAATKINNLLLSSFKAGSVKQGFASLSEADGTGIYNRLTANVLFAEVLPDLGILLREPPAYITNMPEGRLNVSISEKAGKRTASLTVEALDKQNPTRSSKMGVEVYSLPAPPDTQ